MVSVCLEEQNVYHYRNIFCNDHKVTNTVTSLTNSNDDFNNSSSKRLQVKPWKFALAIVYVFISHFTSSVSIVFAQEHLPDPKIYPPLPDILLDNLPYISWSYIVTEGVILFFIILGLAFLVQIIKDGWDRLAYIISTYVGFGMKSGGLKTCGDYVFSGHTVVIILLVLYLNEYTPKHLKYLHIFNWIVGSLGIFFILLGRGHYTLDIVLATGIAGKMFAVQHIFAYNIIMKKRDNYRFRICFPVLFYFERDNTGCIPSQYEWPIRRLKWPFVDL